MWGGYPLSGEFSLQLNPGTVLSVLLPCPLTLQNEQCSRLELSAGANEQNLPSSDVRKQWCRQQSDQEAVAD